MNRIGFATIAAAVAIAGTSLIAGPARAGGTTVLYVGPTGSGTTGCTHSAPCDFVTTLAAATSGTTLIMEPGSYGSSVAPIPSELDVVAGVTLKGDPGQPMPTIYSTRLGVSLAVEGGMLSRVRVITNGNDDIALDMYGGAAVDHVISIDAGSEPACYLPGSATLTDSICTDASGDALAVFDGDSGSSFQAVLRGVTLYSPTGHGLSVANATGSTGSTTVTNSIVHGGGGDIELATSGAGAAITLTLDHDDYATLHSSRADGSSITVVRPAGNRSAAPKFVNAASGDFREAAGSPTIDAGAADTGTDLAGRPRTLGSRPDIGAYELPERPRVSGVHVIKRTAHGLTIGASVLPGGYATTAKVVATHHGHHFSSATKSAGAGTTPKTMSFTVRGLHPHRTYHVSVVATNHVGTTKTAPKTVATKRLHRRHHH